VLAERNDESTAGLSVLFSSDRTTHDPNARFFRARASRRPTPPLVAATHSVARFLDAGSSRPPGDPERGRARGQPPRGRSPRGYPLDLARGPRDRRRVHGDGARGDVRDEVRAHSRPRARLNRPRALTPRTRRARATSRPPPPFAS